MSRRMLPVYRGDCLTAADRYALTAAHTPEDVDPPPPRGWVTGADGEMHPTDGLPDGENALRPCPFVSCKWTLLVDRDPLTGEVLFAQHGNEEELLDGLALGARLRAEGKVAAYLAGTLDPVAYPPGAVIESCALDFADRMAAEENPGGTLEEIGDAMDRTRERVRQVAEGALNHLRLDLSVSTVARLRELLEALRARHNRTSALAELEHRGL